MIVSRSSWHYRLLRFFLRLYFYGVETMLPPRWRENREPHDPMPRNLCAYFWSLIFTLLALVPFLVFAPIFCALAWILLAIKTVKRKVRGEKSKVDSDKPSFAQVTAAFVKAKKQRVCPTIRYDD